MEYISIAHSQGLKAMSSNNFSLGPLREASPPVDQGQRPDLYTYHVQTGLIADRKV